MFPQFSVIILLQPWQKEHQKSNKLKFCSKVITLNCGNTKLYKAKTFVRLRRLENQYLISPWDHFLRVLVSKSASSQPCRLEALGTEYILLVWLLFGCCLAAVVISSEVDGAGQWQFYCLSDQPACIRNGWIANTILNALRMKTPPRL